MMRPTTDRPRQVCRRDFLRGLAAASGTLAAGGLLAAAEPGKKAKRPNLVVIMADDLGAKELGCYGHAKHRTPTLDGLARTGVQFKTCYTAPICHPTRFEIMTGQYGCHNKVFQFAGRPGGPKHTDAAEQITSHLTFAQVLKRGGYATVMAGKWQL